MCSHAAWMNPCMCGTPRRATRNAAADTPRPHPHREITMINMSPGQQEAGNGHAALEPFHRGRGSRIGDDTENRARKHVCRGRRWMRRHLQSQGH